LHSILAGLCTLGLATRAGEEGRYLLGPQIVDYAQSYLDYGGLTSGFGSAAAPFVDATQETVQLARLEGVDVVYLAKVAGSRPLQLPSYVGARLPASATGLGKALLSTLDDTEVRQRYAADGRPLPQLTGRTIRTLDDLIEDLRRARQRGFALDDEEAAPGLACVALPLVVLGDARFAISCSYPAVGDGPDRTAEIAEALVAVRMRMTGAERQS
jgi:DNA-binding IclR family transcriptional regulator